MAPIYLLCRSIPKVFRKFKAALYRPLYRVPNVRPRMGFLLWAVNLLFLGVVVRYAYLSVVPSVFQTQLRRRANRQLETEVVLAPVRAPIVDGRGRVLATTLMATSYFLIPRRVPKNKEIMNKISKVFKVSRKSLLEARAKRKSFLWLKRKVMDGELPTLPLTAWSEFLGTVQEPRRAYPEGVSPLLGFVGADNEGLSGLEYSLNNNLRGQPQSFMAMRDALNRPTLILANETVKPREIPKAIELSLDQFIQHIAEKHAWEALQKTKSQRVSIVVLDGMKSRILAMAGVDSPHFTPETAFAPTMDGLELGSVLKPFVVACAMDKGLITAKTTFFCENGHMSIPGGIIHDDHPSGTQSVEDILVHSSNIGLYKIARRLGKQGLFDCYRDWGLLSPTGVPLPGQWSPKLPPPDQWKEMRFANLAFGQGIALSPLQFTKGFAHLVTDGMVRPLQLVAPFQSWNHWLSRNHGPQGKTILSLRSMLQKVVAQGTGKRATLSSFSSGGKTGTSQKFDRVKGTYTQRIASFVGYAPAEKPKIVVAVILDAPEVRPAYGGVWAAPVFASVAEETLNYLNAQGLWAADANQHVLSQRP